MKTTKLILLGLATLVVQSLRAAPPFSGTIFIDPDIITAADPTTFAGMTYAGQGVRLMYDRRINNFSNFNVFLYNASFNDGLTVEVQVNAEFGTTNAAAFEANKYATVVGRLPTVLRSQVQTFWIHKGVQPFGGGNHNLLIHTGQATNYEADGILEETFVHEASHTSLDGPHAAAAGWRAAQTADPEFISTYARDNPTQEDVAETFLTWLAVRYRSSRISGSLSNTIATAVPNRLAYFSAQNFNLYPIAARVEASVPGDVIVATSPNSPTTQTAPNAIDNNATTKYLNFDKLNTGMTITPIGQRPVHALTLISAEDAPESDPSSFVIEGSNNGTNFTRIASNAVPTFPTRHFIRSLGLASTNVFTYYRVLFPTVSDAATANSMQIAEVELLFNEEITSTNDVVSITLPPGAVDVSGVGMLFDRQLDDIHKLEIAPLTNSNTTVDITLAAGTTVLKGFEVIGAADDFTFPERRPRSVTVAGSSNGINYTNLATVIPAIPSFNLQIQEFSTSSNTTSFARYRVTFGPPVSGDRLQVGEMRLFGEVIPRLTITLTATNTAVVSWPFPSAGFALEQNPTPGTTNWTSVTNTISNDGSLNRVVVPASGGNKMFRLKK